MERLNAVKEWDDDDRYYLSSHSDDSPILSYRFDKNRRYIPYVAEGKVEERERRSTITVLAKFFLFCSAMILFCILMYIPVYNKAYDIDLAPKAIIPGWSKQTNRDTKLYIQPKNITTIYEPKTICPKDEKEKNQLFLLIIVCSSTTNFDERLAIRETWGSYEKYIELEKIYIDVREKYKNYNFDYDLDSVNTTKRPKRNISSFNQLIPELVDALKNYKKTDEEQRFDDEMLPEFDMNDVDDTAYDYDTNVMKIPPKGSSHNLNDVLAMLKENFPSPTMNVVPSFKLMFLLGLPKGNGTKVQSRIDEEIEKYGDVLQEDFIDSYNNLTLKSIMMLKWVTNNCKDSVRYILKTDDDMYINVPNLIYNLRERAKQYDEKAVSQKGEEYLLMGDLICGAKPVFDPTSKWFSPKYMYAGRVYPRYLSGTGYLLSSATAKALYLAALKTPYFHLEDIYITGMCASRASPHITPIDDPTFTYKPIGTRFPCFSHSHVTSHRVAIESMRAMTAHLVVPYVVDKCERQRLTQKEEEDDYEEPFLYKYLLSAFSKTNCD